MGSVIGISGMDMSSNTHGTDSKADGRSAGLLGWFHPTLYSTCYLSCFTRREYSVHIGCAAYCHQCHHLPVGDPESFSGQNESVDRVSLSMAITLSNPGSSDAARYPGDSIVSAVHIHPDNIETEYLVR